MRNDLALSSIEIPSISQIGYEMLESKKACETKIKNTESYALKKTAATSRAPGSGQGPRHVLSWVLRHRHSV
jgi:hypothetical protein